MRHFALIGRTLTHSYSKQLFDAQHFAGADYRLCPLPSTDGLREWVRREAIDGFNVTVPYKQAVVPLLDAVSPEAAAIGAVNCVTVRDGRLTGHNTDAPAFRDTLATLTHSGGITVTKALVLGTGGAAQAVAYALRQLAIPCSLVSRNPALHPGVLGYPQLAALPLPPTTLIVNATPVGMHPASDASPWPFPQLFDPNCLIYDLIYNPSPTLLMRQAAARGAKVTDGLAMLRRQAELSWQLFDLQVA